CEIGSGPEDAARESDRQGRVRDHRPRDDESQLAGRPRRQVLRGAFLRGRGRQIHRAGAAHALRRRARQRHDHQPPHRGEPGEGRRRPRHRHGVHRGIAHRSPDRDADQSQLPRRQGAGAPGGPGNRSHLRRVLRSLRPVRRQACRRAADHAVGRDDSERDLQRHRKEVQGAADHAGQGPARDPGLTSRRNAMKSFENVDPKSVKEAVGLLQKYAGEKKNAAVVGGGSEYLQLMKVRVATPDYIVNLKTIPGLSYIKEDSGGFRIGALTTLADLEEHKGVQEKLLFLSQAAGEAASPQIRNAGTVAGNLCERPFCWYFRSASHVCLRKGGEICYSVAGDNRYHAILGGGPSYIVHPSDLAPALVALDAKIKIAGPAGEKT